MHCGKTSSKSKRFSWLGYSWYHGFGHFRLCIAFIVYCIYLLQTSRLLQEAPKRPTTIAPTIYFKWSMMKSSRLHYVHLNPHCALSSHCLTALCVVKAAVLQQQPAQLAQLSWPSAGSREVAPSCSAPVTRLTLTRVRSRAANVCFTISWLKAPNSTFTFKTLLRHYAKCALTQSK